VRTKLLSCVELISVFLFICFVGSEAGAEIYFVSSSIGNDSNDGKSPAAAWAHCPGMVGYTGSGSLAAGDIVCFNGDDTWTGGAGYDEYLNLTGGVVYDGSGWWGTGTLAKLQLSGDLNSYTLNGATQRDNPVVRMAWDDAVHGTIFANFEIDCNGYNGSGIAINRPSDSNLVGATKCIINVVIHNSSTVANGGQGIVIGAGNGNNVGNVVIYHCQIYDMSSNGIIVYEEYRGGASYISGVYIGDNEISNVGCGVSTGGNGIKIKNNVQNVLVEYNAVHGMRDDDAGHALVVEADADTTAPNFMWLRYNLINDNLNKGIVVRGINDSSTTSYIDIYGNLIVNNNSDAVHLQSTLGGTVAVRIYNNTCFENGSSGTGEIVVSASSATLSPFELTNNILSPLSNRFAFHSETRNRLTSHVNNTYYHSDASPVVQDGGNTYTTATITSWEATGSGSDPGFQDTSLPPSYFIGTYAIDCRPNTDGFQLSSTSPAVNSGTSLPTGYDFSINSVSRPQGAAWDRGAYEFEE